VAYLARREAIYREPGALIDEGRLWTNLLSSAPLTFNLLGPLALDLSLATCVVHRLWPDLRDRGAQVRSIWFEHSPGRGQHALTADGTAFDALIRYTTARADDGFVAVEMKYSEEGHEPAPNMRPRYDELADTSGLFIDASSPALRANPLQQFWREHLLAHAMVARGDYNEGRFVVIAPRLNRLVQNAVGAYRRHLAEVGARGIVFEGHNLERVISAIADAGEREYAASLHRRYSDFRLLDKEIELALSAAASIDSGQNSGGPSVQPRWSGCPPGALYAGAIEPKNAASKEMTVAVSELGS
jgi:hypothetical protein